MMKDFRVGLKSRRGKLPLTQQRRSIMMPQAPAGDYRVGVQVTGKHDSLYLQHTRNVTEELRDLKASGEFVGGRRTSRFIKGGEQGWASSFNCNSEKHIVRTYSDGRVETEIEAGGPGSGRHPEFGQFKKATTGTGGKYPVTHYLSPKTSVSIRSFPRHVDHSTVYEHPRGSLVSNIKHTGSRESAKQFMKDTYGIDHKFSKPRERNW